MVNGKIDFFFLVEMQRLVEGLGNEEEEGDKGFEVYVGKGWEDAENHFHLSAGTYPLSAGISVKFASGLEVFPAARVGFSGGERN